MQIGACPRVPDINPDGKLCKLRRGAVSGNLRERTDQGNRQIVDAIIIRIFQVIESRTFPCTGHAGHNHKPHESSSRNEPTRRTSGSS